jgi:hypothetical protein
MTLYFFGKKRDRHGIIAKLQADLAFFQGTVSAARKDHDGAEEKKLNKIFFHGCLRYFI